MSFWKRSSRCGARRMSVAGRSASALTTLACLGLLATAADASAPGRATPIRATFPALAAAPSSSAYTARVLSVNDTGRLHEVEENGSLLLEEGPASGTLPGSVRARLTLGTTVTIGFTLYLRGGTMSGHGSAKLNPGKGQFASFNGTLAVTHGSGRYAHASGNGGLYGTIDRLNNDNAVVQVVGRLHL